MANGKPGDDPISDIVEHKLPRFSPQIDELVRRLARVTSPDDLRKMFDWFEPPPLPEFEQQLRARVERLELEARDRGWES
jgi:hypothetical protein